MPKDFKISQPIQKLITVTFGHPVGLVADSVRYQNITKRREPTLSSRRQSTRTRSLSLILFPTQTITWAFH